MTSGEFYIQAILIPIFFLVLFFLTKYGRQLLSEFSLLWSSDPQAKSLSFFQLTLALATTNQFKSSGNKVREEGGKLLTTLMVSIVLVTTIRIVLPIVEEEMRRADIGTDVIITEEELENSKPENMLRDLINNNKTE